MSDSKVVILSSSCVCHSERQRRILTLANKDPSQKRLRMTADQQRLRITRDQQMLLRETR